jgi:hypothetical protein
LVTLVSGIFTPPPETSVSEWVESHVIIPPPQTQSSGLVSFNGRDYIREALDDFNLPGITDIALCFGSQAGKTTLLQCAVSWIIVCSPSGILWVMPTLPNARSFSTTRWQPIVRATPELDVMIPRGGQSRHDFTKLEQILGGSVLNFVGSNSPANLASRPARVVIQDEVDKFAQASDKEADACSLADQRTKDKARPLRVKTSTPTTTDGPIWQEFTKGDQRRYWVPCPLCRKLVLLTWGKQFTVFPLTGCEAVMEWDKEAKRANGEWDMDRVHNSARMVCPHCQGHITNERKTWMLRAENGACWKPSNQASRGFRSRHLSSLYATSSQTSFGNLAIKFIRERKSFSGLQGFINGDLAEPWENQDGRAERIEIVTERPIEESVRQLTADVQAVAPFIWWTVREWHKGHSRLVGAGWADDFAALRRVQLHFAVDNLDVGVDMGYNSQTVYDECAQWSTPSNGAIVYESGLRFPPEGHTKAPSLIGWTPMKGREEGARFTTKTGHVHPVGITVAPSSRMQLAQQLLVFDTEHMRGILARIRRPVDGVSQWAACPLPCDIVADGVVPVGPDEYWRHLDSHSLKPLSVGRMGKTKMAFIKRTSKWPDHMHDCEIMQLALAFLWGRLTI